MDNIVLITQGSQAIQLVRTLFALRYKPNQLIVYTIEDNKNKCFIEFLKYYKISYLTNIENQNWDDKIIISYANNKKLNITKNAKFINFHPGILPNYKGSLSTVYSMINNEKKVGGTWHYMTNKIDAGNILYQFKIKVSKLDTAFSLNHKIFQESLNCLDKVLKKVKLKNKGKKQILSGKFYYNKFPDINQLDKDLQKRINYFPPIYT